MNKVKLKDFAEIIMGQSPEAKFVFSENVGLPLLNGPAEFTNKYPIPVQYTTNAKRISNTHDILFCVRGSTTGRMNIANQNYAIGRGLAAIRHKTNSKLNVYVKAQIEINLKKLLGGTLGSVFPNLTKDNLFDLECYIHNEKDQQKIASVLSALDDKIELNNRINAELEAMAKTLYDYWFVQFDFPNSPPLEGWQNSKNFDGAVGYKSSGGKMVYNETLKREIPEGWEVKSLSGLVDFTRGISYTSSTINDKEGLPMINLKSFNLNGTYRIDGLKYFTGKLNESKIINKNDLLIAITDVTREAEIIGKAILSPDFGNKTVCSCDVARIDILKNSFSKNYLRYLFNSNHYHNYIKHFASGTLVLHLDLNGILLYKDIIPPISLQNKFENIVNEIDKKIANNLKQNQELSALRDWLLPMLMNGQVKVGEIVENKEAKIVELNKSQIVKPGDFKECFTDKDKKVCRKMLATFIINESLNDQSFGKTKFEKLLHLVEYHLVKGDFNQSYTVQAAGPYDGAFTKTFWSEVLKGEWFKIEELGSLKRIKAGKNHIKSLKDYGYFSESLKESVRGFVHKFSNSNYEQPEIISTLFAVWNNRIIRKEIITDELIKEDFLNWDLGKGKYANRLDKALDWMRKEGIIPNGWGKEIKRTKKK